MTRNPVVALGVVGAVSFVITAGITKEFGTPEPGIHDEFSHLLAGDTLARGRLTNPPHPLWMHFETIHVLQQPTYASRYPPMQGLCLAAGKAVGGHPIVGVWLSTAVAGMAVYWMLAGWLPRRWAFLGGLLCAIHPLVVHWGQSYWGGAPAMTGGALVVGAGRRILRRIRVRDAILLGLGLAILANSRPYEGLVLTLLMAVTFGVWLLKERPPWGLLIRKLVLPVACVLALSAAGMACLNFKVTGNPWQLPYLKYRQTYSPTPMFLWQKPGAEPKYNHEVLRQFHMGWEMGQYERQQTFADAMGAAREKLVRMYRWYLWLFVWLVPLCVLPWALKRDRKLLWAVVVAVLFNFCFLPVTWSPAMHYAAPVFGVFLYLGLQSMRHLRHWTRRGAPVGGALVFAVLLVFLTTFEEYCRHEAGMGYGNYDRAEVMEKLSKEPARHLVVVRYGKRHNPLMEWVYNEADIDNARIVWARGMDAKRDRELLDWFKGRKVWLLEPDILPIRVKPYPREELEVTSGETASPGGLPTSGAPPVPGPRAEQKQ